MASKLTPDILQNELLLIAHHVSDALESLDDPKKIEIVRGSLHDIDESLERLGKLLPKQFTKEMKRMNHQMILLHS